MLYHEENVRDCIRNRQGKRVFYLGQGDTLTPAARDWLHQQRIEILPATLARPEEYRRWDGGYFREKPESFTHLRGDILVPKTHPVIAFRGAMDSLEAELLLAQQAAPAMQKEIGEILTLARNLLRWEVMEEPIPETRLLGLNQAQLRQQSHFPQNHFGISHFMPECTDGPVILQLNKARTAARRAELAAAHAFADTRPELIQTMNRLSSAIYILMLKEKANP